MMRGKKPIQLNLKTVPMEIRNRMENTKSWYKNFDHPKLLGDRSLAVVVDRNGNPSYRYRSNIDGQDSVEINTPMNNVGVTGPFIKHEYPSYPFTAKKLGRNKPLKRKHRDLIRPTLILDTTHREAPIFTRLRKINDIIQNNKIHKRNPRQ